jgi:hypothetical protein
VCSVFLKARKQRGFDDRRSGLFCLLCATAVSLPLKVKRIPPIAAIGRLKQRQGVPP